MKQAFRPAILAGCLVWTACAGSSEPPRTAAAATPADTAPMHEHQGMQMPMQMHMDMPDLSATDGPGFKAADARFMQGMIAHHAQAITMSDMAPTHGAGSRVRQLANKIDISQRDEIVMMKDWLADRNQAVPDSAQVAAMMMPGMLTPEQMARLAAARGIEFDRLYLSFMIGHHRGALQMVSDLFDSPGAAQDPDIFRFVTDVDADQRAEIYVMQSMLGMLDTAGGSR